MSTTQSDNEILMNPENKEEDQTKKTKVKLGSRQITGFNTVQPVE